MSAAAPQAERAPRELAQDMLLGQHSIGYASAFTGLPLAQVEELARKLHAAKRIPRVRP
ncbi:hypothetical protein [Sediminicoccus sp. KRV36]|uniref:hypothetical protein n=1 Tax=Sediminicoccus sp. KRV36 TaxID=3133721 RepID=UPI00200F6392|nr:hypothetical protein [Sediminicoccus rosea]UPY35507.1 hypothetical protein LHU95_14910 [Sediminicoccus rosea]